jgi:hypothetical protein
MYKKSLILIAAFFVLIATSGAASAKWIDFDKNGVDPGTVVKMKFPNYSSGIKVLIGEHLLDFEQFEGAAQGMDANIPGYCIEDQIVLNDPLDYTVRGVTYERDKDAAWLYKSFGSLFNPTASGDQKKYNQAAIWNVFMDDDYSLGAGSVQVLNNDGIKNGANGLLGALTAFKYTAGNELSQAWLDYDFSNIYIATHPDSQDFIYGNLVHTPVPAAIWLLGSGILGLVGIRMRKRV